MRNQDNNWLLKKRFFRIVHFFAVFGMVHSTILLPAQSIADSYFNFNEFYSFENSINYKNFQEGLKDQTSFSYENSSSLIDNVLSKRINSSNGEIKELANKLNNAPDIALAYISDIKEGTIGVSKESPFDNAADNIFKFDIADIPQNSNKVFLTYELYGVQDHNAVARSINSRPSVGGYIIKTNHEWASQKEEINASWLQKGENSILFTLANKARYFYKVRNVKIEIEKNKKSNVVVQQLVIQPQNILFTKGGKAFIKGFIRNPHKGVKILIEGTELEVQNGEFEGLIPVTNFEKKKFILAQATDENGLVGQTLIPLHKRIEADKAFPLEKASVIVSGFFKISTASAHLEMEGASIVLEDSSLTKDIQISISKLRKIDIAPMESGMINVTRGGSAFRFTPDGTKFNKPAKIVVGYDTTLIPNGYRPEDIKTYFFNTSSKRWEVLPTDTIDIVNNAVVSITTHFTDYINGVIQVPESPQSSAFTSTMMNDIKAADPASNITLISPPDASQTGDANLSYPIKIPAGRKGMQPQLALQYSSEGGDGWIGSGWNLSVPGISIDTKWGIPTFGDKNGDGDNTDADEAIETEIYKLGNEQLMYPMREIDGKNVDWMPNRHYGETNSILSTHDLPRISQANAEFTFRNQGSFAKIQRMGDLPSTYFWKVTGTDGTINWYGGKTLTDVQNSLAVIKDPNGNIVHWALFMTEDVYGNNVKYTYSSSIFANTTGVNANLSGGQMFYLTQVTYTGYNGSVGNYKVNFIKKASVKSDVSINARMGFKQIDPYLLEKIEVSYKDQLIRSYKLNYKTGRYSKTLLDSISENDKTGKEFYSHKFEYYDDILQDGVETYFAAAVTETMCPDKCYSVSFPVPIDPDVAIYSYDLNIADWIIAFDGESCMFPESVARITNFVIDGTEYTPQPDNMYLTHYSNNSITNLCPRNEELIYNTPYSLIQNEAFVPDMTKWLYSTVFQTITPFDMNITNESVVFCSDSACRAVTHHIHYGGKFKSIFSVSGYSTIKMNDPVGPVTRQISRLNSNMAVGLTTEVSVSTDAGITNFGAYNFSDQYYIDKFQNDFRDRYDGTPPPTVSGLNGIISIQVPATDLKFNFISLIGGGITNTYYFNACGSDSYIASNNYGWQDAKSTQEDVEWAVKKSIADGNELTMPIPEIALNIIVEVSKEQIDKSPIAVYKSLNDTINWHNYYDFSIEGVFMLHIAKDSTYWQDNNGKQIVHPKVINVLNALETGNRSKIYDDYQRYNRENVLKSREQERYRAIAEVEGRHKGLSTDWGKDKIEKTGSGKIFQKSLTDTLVNQFADYLKKSKAIKTSYFDNLQNRYKIDIKRLSPLSDTGCNPIINTHFIIQSILPSFNSTASMLGSTTAKSLNLGAYLGAGIGWNHSSKKTTFGGQYTHGWDYSNAFLSLVDIDGDGLDDIVVKQDNSLYYKKHIITRTYDDKNLAVVIHSFSPNKPINSINNFFYQKGQSSSLNFQATFGISLVGGFAGIDFSKSKSETNIYLTDVNADGLIDIVKNGTVFFNRIVDGNPFFEADSKRTENMVITALPKQIETPLEYLQEEIIYPDNDVVKMWEAPATGTIKITNEIELMDPTKETEVTIEMKADTLVQGECYVVGFVAPTAISTVYSFHQSCNLSSEQRNYQNIEGKPYSDKIYSLNGVIAPIDKMWVTHYINNACHLIIPDPNAGCDFQDWDKSIQNPLFETEYENFIYETLNHDPFNVSVINNSGFRQCPNGYPDDVIDFTADFNSLVYYGNYYNNMSCMMFAGSCSNFNLNNVFAHWFLRTTSTDVIVPVSTNIIITCASGTYPYGPYMLYDPFQVSLFQADLQAQFQSAIVTSVNGSVTINIPNSTSEVISITLTGGGTTNTYNFAPCGDDNPIARSSNDWENAKPEKKDVEWAVKKAVANGSDLELPIPETPINYLLDLSGNQTDKSLSGFYNAAISKDSVEWQHNNGEIITDAKVIYTLNSLLPIDRETYYNEVQRYHHDITIKNRIAQRDTAKTEVEAFYKEKYAAMAANTQKSANTTSSCDYQTGQLCLLYGTVLNSSQTTVNNVLTTTSGNCNSTPGPITVKKGDRIYFRVHNVENGNPPVNWNPKVEYTDAALATTLDQNGLTPYMSTYDDGFILSSESGIVFPGNGMATISWDPVQVNNQSDSVTFEIVKSVFIGDNEIPTTELVIFSQPCNAGSISTVSSSGFSPVVVSGYTDTIPKSTLFYFRVKANSNVNWKQIEWKPKMVCSTSATIIGEDGTLEDTIITNETKYPIVDYAVYKSFICSSPYNLFNLSAIEGTNMNISPLVNGLFTSADSSGILSFVVKSNNMLVGTRIITVTDGVVSIDNSSPIPLPDSNANIEIGYYSDDSKLDLEKTSLLEKIALSSNPVALIQSGSSNYNVNKVQVNLFQKPNAQFGPMYRQWGQFMYNPDSVKNAVPISSMPGYFIKEEALLVTVEQAEKIEQASTELENSGYDDLDLSNPDDLAAFQNSFALFQQNNQSFCNSTFIVATPDREYINNYYQEKWIGLHKECYSSALSSRAAGFNQSFSGFINEDDETIQEVIHTGAYAISKFSKGSSKNISAGINVEATPTHSFGITGSKSLDGKSSSLSDFVDMNGDRYPDIVTTENIQLTTRTGGLFAKNSRNPDFAGDYMKSESDSWGIGATGSFSDAGKSSEGSSGADKAGKFSWSNPVIGKPKLSASNGNSSIGISGNYSQSKDETTRLWADLNGDGLSDLLEKNGDTVKVKLNYGNNGFNSIQQADWGNFYLSKNKSQNIGVGGTGFNYKSGSIEGGIALNNNFASQEYTIQDINGDGLLDIIHSQDGFPYNRIDVRINNGNHFSTVIFNYAIFSLKNSAVTVSESANIGVTFAWITPFFGIPFKFPCVAVNGQAASSTNKTKKTISDFDGDGFPDLLQEVDNNIINVRYSNIRRTNKLKSVTNPLGGKFTIDYQVKTKTYNNPNAKWVMSDVVIDDGYDLANDGCDTYRKNFEYENGKYDRREREFYGFETVKTIDYTVNPDSTKGEAYRTSVTKYLNNSYYLKGLVKESYVYKGSDTTQLYSSQENLYELKSLANKNTEIDLASNLPFTFDIGGTEGRGTACVLLKETTGKIYELTSSPIVAKTGMVYDKKGRVTAFTNYGDISNITDDYTTAISYYSNSALTDKNIINIPNSITVTANSLVVRTRSTSNINNINGAIGTITSTIDASNTAETNLDYDEYGNLKNIEFPPNNIGQKMTYKYQYDGDNAKFINTITDAFGYNTITTYDPKFDVLLQTMDISGNIIQNTYDDFGRLTKITGPNEIGIGVDPYTIKFEYFPRYIDAAANTNYASCINSTDFVPVAITHHFDPQHSTNGIETFAFVDGLGRPIQVKKDIEINTNPDRHGTAIYIEAMSVSGKVSYDIYGRAIEQFHPNSENKVCGINFLVNNAPVLYSSKTEYDELDRPVKSTDPEGKISTMAYSISGNLIKTRSVVDQNGSQSIISESYKDASGNVVKSINLGPNGNVLTSFIYDAIGELMSYQDADNLTSSYSYDKLGRKTSFTHPDNGLTTYYYDKASNLIKLQTANLAGAGEFVNYEYDFNRLVAVKYPPVSGGVNISNTSFLYGGLGTGNQAGRLVSQTDASGKQSFEYGNMGEVIFNQRTVVAPAPNLPTRTFVTKYTYDSWNRLQSMIYPDYEDVEFKYDFGGNIKQITGTLNGTPYNYIQRIDYDYYEQRTYLKYGNNTETFYDFEPSLRRLQNLNVKAANSNDLVQNKYFYDNIGNITSLENAAAPSTVNGMGGAYRNGYTYDVLNRLSSAEGDFTGDKATQLPLGNDYDSRYSLQMAYGNTGGILAKNQEHTKVGVAVPANTYQNTYTYMSGSHKLQSITNQALAVENFDYDKNGNIISREKAHNLTSLYWDEANRLRVIAFPQGAMQHNIYDASGERILKAGSQATQVYVNGTLQNNTITMNNYTSYPSGFLVVDPAGIYSKHYYLGSQRIASRIGDGTSAIFEGKADDMPELKTLQQRDLQYFAAKAGHTDVSYTAYTPATLNDIADEEGSKGETAIAIYYYHPDHLGSNTFITDISGNPYQLFLNLPFGESMAEQSSTGYFQSPYKFNGKELDKETGLYYYGARYYDPRTSLWLSVDPLAEKYPHQSNYAYCSNNPIMIIDPNGMDEWEVNIKGYTSKVPKTESKTDILYSLNEKGTRTGQFIEINKGLLESKQSSPSKSSSGEPITIDMYSSESDATATKMYEFIASNTEAEFGHEKYGINDNAIYTSHQPGELHGDPKEGFKTIRERIHSHPYNELRQSFGPSTTDNNSAAFYSSKTNRPIFKIFHPKKGYVIYNTEPGYFKPMVGDIFPFIRKFRASDYIKNK